MIVEFLGSTGAGKTPLVPILTQLLRDDDLMAMSVTEAIHYYTAKTRLGQVVCILAPKTLRGPILWRLFSYVIAKLHMVQFAIQKPRLVRYVVRSQLRRPIPWRHRWLIVRLFFRMASESHFLSSHTQADEVLVFDEGFVHRAVHMFVSESEQINPDQIIEYLELLPRSDLVISAKAPLDTCLARIQARGLQTRLNNLTPQEIARFMANAEQVVNIASQYLKDTGWSIVEIANDSDLAVCTAELHDNVAPYLSHMANAVG